MSKCKQCLGRGYYESLVPPENPGISADIPTEPSPIKPFQTKYVLCPCGYGGRIYHIIWGHKNITTVDKLLEIFSLYFLDTQIYLRNEKVFDRGELVGSAKNVPRWDLLGFLRFHSIYKKQQVIFVTCFGDFEVIWEQEDPVSEIKGQVKALSRLYLPKEKEIEGLP